MRKLSYKPLISGFIEGLHKGMSSSNYAFEIEVMVVPEDRFVGLRHDRDALRGDVQRAKAKFDSDIKNRKGCVAAR